MYYKNKTHQRIFEEQVNGNPCKCPNEYLAALYLLTADRELWNAAKRVIGRKEIDFPTITGNPDLAAQVNLYYRNRIQFFNGPIDCRLFIYEGCELKGQNAL